MGSEVVTAVRERAPFAARAAGGADLPAVGNCLDVESVNALPVVAKEVLEEIVCRFGARLRWDQAEAKGDAVDVGVDW